MEPLSEFARAEGLKTGPAGVRYYAGKHVLTLQEDAGELTVSFPAARAENEKRAGLIEWLEKNRRSLGLVEASASGEIIRVVLQTKKLPSVLFAVQAFSDALEVLEFPDRTVCAICGASGGEELREENSRVYRWVHPVCFAHEPPPEETEQERSRRALAAVNEGRSAKKGFAASLIASLLVMLPWMALHVVYESAAVFCAFFIGLASFWAYKKFRGRIDRGMFWIAGGTAMLVSVIGRFLGVAAAFSLMHALTPAHFTDYMVHTAPALAGSVLLAGAGAWPGYYSTRLEYKQQGIRF